MQEISHILFFLFPIMEIVGLLLIALEVLLGHRMEEIAAGFHVVKKLQFHYAMGDAYGYTLQVMLNNGVEPLVARGNTDEMKKLGMLQKNMDDDWNKNFTNATASIKRYEQKTAEIAMKKRRQNLFLGTFLLVAGALGHLFEAAHATL